MKTLPRPIDLHILSANLAFFDEIYAQYRRDPMSIDPDWRDLFDADETAAPESHAALHQAFFLARVWALVNAYRSRGHLQADLDPLGLHRRDPHPELDPATYGLTARDLERTVPGGVWNGAASLSLAEILRRARATYCGSIGVEFMHVSSPDRKEWLWRRMEASQNGAALDPATRIAILDKLVAAEKLESFLHTKYVGTKRFSLEGGETLIPLLDQLLEQAGRHDVEEAVLGMAHRGRLNVLVNTLGKKPREIFAEFEDLDPESALGSGDVKYHLGTSHDHTTRGGRTIHLSLAFNPSHLEAVNPVVVGRVRAKQRRRRDWDHARVVGILVHGDAAFAGQGLVPETLNLSQLHGYKTGGTVHVVVNNQIGFTATPVESRSTPYATDVAKMLECPIFHVNGEDPDAVAHVVALAMDYRRAFACDVVIDLWCYRKYGHNESDEPSFTQPLMVQRIQHKEPVAAIYARRLAEDGILDADEVHAMRGWLSRWLEDELAQARASSKRPTPDSGGGVWEGWLGGPDADVPEVDTGVAKDRLAFLGERVTALPDGFTPHAKIARLFAQRRAMARGEQPIDWGMAETLAFGSILLDGRLVRLSGQDSCRGTFSQRHAVVADVVTGAEHAPLAHLAPDQGECRIYDSALSEAAVLGFEFGYSLDYPDGLIAWEAQFGDFVNGAQVLIDQFISSSEDKWKRISGLVLLLPHGYEGQGPEHSSARYERFLQACAEDNLQVVIPTTPAQYFHLLRRQIHRPWRKPLVVMTPKSLLRHPACVSTIDELAAGRFRRVLDDPQAPPESQVRRILVCSGKIFYELAAERERRADRRTAIVRIEQLYPWSEELVASTLARYGSATEIVWVQEEPANMGALSFVEPRLRRMAGSRGLTMVSRAANASPATGSSKAHAIEQRAVIEEAFC